MSTSLRDHFATKAMQALLMGHAGPNDDDAKRIAEQAYRMANAMCGARANVVATAGRYACASCMDGKRPHQRIEAGIVLQVPCPHCGVDPTEERAP